MNIKLIKTEGDYQLALQRLDEIFDAEPDTPKSYELEVLSFLIDTYEKEHFNIEAPDPIEAIKFRMEQLEIKQKDLAEVLGFKSRVSKVLNKKRKLTLEMIRNFHQRLNIPTNVLIQEYREKNTL